jgi:hypothetical protein
MSKDKYYYSERKTNNFIYGLHIELTETRGKYNNLHLYVGDKDNLCLSLSFHLPSILEDSRFTKEDISIAKLNIIKNLKGCIIEDSSPINLVNKPAFAKEMLFDIISFVKQFEHIKFIRLADYSNIECDGESDSLDMLSYYIALHEKTWYETNFNSFFLPEKRFIDYRCKVATYASPETKKKTDWNTMFDRIKISSNEYSYRIFIENDELYKELYESSKTLPEFFRKLTETIPRKDKCKFFKSFFESILNFYSIDTSRIWFISLYNVPAKYVAGSYNKKRKTNKTRRRKL